MTLHKANTYEILEKYTQYTENPWPSGYTIPTYEAMSGQSRSKLMTFL